MTQAHAAGPRRRAVVRRAFILAALALCLALVAAWAVTVGSSPIALSAVVSAFRDFDGSREHIVVMSVRLPRVLAGLVVGAALAVAGAIMQAMTNNPLASPGLLGINAGAAFAVVVAIGTAGSLAGTAYVWIAFAGAGTAGTIVYLLGSVGRSGPTPVKLALAGVVFGAFVSSLTMAILIFDRITLDEVRLWTVGSLAGRDMAVIGTVIPYAAIGLAAALLTAREMTTLSLGPEVARALGQRRSVWLAAGAVIVVLLAGGAVALAGPIGFVGLVLPHIARMVVGADYRWIIPFCALGGPLLVVAADASLRHALPGRDIPVGITMAVLGAPFFIYLARFRLRSG